MNGFEGQNYQEGQNHERAAGWMKRVCRCVERPGKRTSAIVLVMTQAPVEPWRNPPTLLRAELQCCGFSPSVISSSSAASAAQPLVLLIVLPRLCDHRPQLRPAACGSAPMERRVDHNAGLVIHQQRFAKNADAKHQVATCSASIGSASGDERRTVHREGVE